MELLISHLTDKNKINDFEINSELKKSFINTCIEGIIEILKNIKSNDELIKIIFIRIINAIISSINTINNIDLIEKMFKLDIKKNTKEGIDKYCKEKSIIKEIHKDLFMYIKNSTEGNEKENKIEIEKRIDLIFLLIENGVSISNDEFKILFYEISKINEITKQIFYTKMKENILKINTKLREYIFENLLLNKDANFEINDFMSYQLLKEFILQINKSKGKFIFITNKDMLVISNNFCKDIYGHDSLWDILLKTNNNEIRNDIGNFLSNIYLVIKYKAIEDYKKFWTFITKKIIDNLKLATSKSDNNNAIKGLICLLKKININSENDGDLNYSKNIISSNLEQHKNKEEDKKDLKTEGKKIKKDDKKEGKKEELNKDKNEDIPIKIRLEYNEMKNNTSKETQNDKKGKQKKVLEIYNNTFFYNLRYLISYEFRIPLKCIQLKKPSNECNINNNLLEKKNTISDKKGIPKTGNSLNLLYDYINVIEYFPELKQYMRKKSKKDNEENYPEFIVENIQNPLND